MINTLHTLHVLHHIKLKSFKNKVSVFEDLPFLQQFGIGERKPFCFGR